MSSGGTPVSLADSSLNLRTPDLRHSSYGQPFSAMSSFARTPGGLASGLSFDAHPLDLSNAGLESGIESWSEKQQAHRTDASRPSAAELPGLSVFTGSATRVSDLPHLQSSEPTQQSPKLVPAAHQLEEVNRGSGSRVTAKDRRVEPGVFGRPVYCSGASLQRAMVKLGVGSVAPDGESLLARANRENDLMRVTDSFEQMLFTTMRADLTHPMSFTHIPVRRCPTPRNGIDHFAYLPPVLIRSVKQHNIGDAVLLLRDQLTQEPMTLQCDCQQRMCQFRIHCTCVDRNCPWPLIVHTGGLPHYQQSKPVDSLRAPGNTYRYDQE